jgi:hypothetical protein
VLLYRSIRNVLSCHVTAYATIGISDEPAEFPVVLMARSLTAVHINVQDLKGVVHGHATLDANAATHLQAQHVCSGDLLPSQSARFIESSFVPCYLFTTVVSLST